MSRKSFYFSSAIADAESNEDIDEEQKLDQQIMLALQEIDSNFSLANNIITESIIPKALQYQKSTKKMWEGFKFMKTFFENSADVNLLTEKDRRNEKETQEDNRKGFSNTSDSYYNVLQSPNRFTTISSDYQGDIQTNEVINDETTRQGELDSLLLEDPTRTRKRLMSSTPNLKKTGIPHLVPKTQTQELNSSFIGESSTFLPPTLEFFRQNKGHSGNKGTNPNGSPQNIRDRSSLTQEFQTAHEFSQINTNDIDLHTSTQTRHRSPSRERSRSASIIEEHTPRRKRRRGSTSSRSHGLDRNYDSSPEMEAPVLLYDKYYSSPTKGSENDPFQVHESDEEKGQEFDRQLRSRSRSRQRSRSVSRSRSGSRSGSIVDTIRRKSLDNINSQGERLSRFPLSPRYGAGGILYRFSNGKNLMLNYKDASTASTRLHAPDNNDFLSSNYSESDRDKIPLLTERPGSFQHIASSIIQNEDSSADDIQEDLLAGSSGRPISAMSQKYASDDDDDNNDVILEEKTNKVNEITNHNVSVSPSFEGSED